MKQDATMSEADANAVMALIETMERCSEGWGGEVYAPLTRHLTAMHKLQGEALVVALLEQSDGDAHLNLIANLERMGEW